MLRRSTLSSFKLREDVLEFNVSTITSYKSVFYVYVSHIDTMEMLKLVLNENEVIELLTIYNFSSEQIEDILVQVSE